MLTKADLRRIAPNAQDDILEGVIQGLPLMFSKGINTNLRIAHFLGQIAHETNGFRTLKENLNYSVEALLRVFPRYFGPSGVHKRDPNLYARNPEKLANFVYQDEYRTKSGALGNTEPGDGYRYIGRGYIQTTGRHNYQEFMNISGVDVITNPMLLEDPKSAFEAAVHYWTSRNLNELADQDNLEAITLRINGGLTGLEDRKVYVERAKALDIKPIEVKEHNVPVKEETKPAIRIILRYISGALVTAGAISAGTGDAVVTVGDVVLGDPEFIGALSVIAGAVIGGVSELWYKIAKRRGGAT